MKEECLREIGFGLEGKGGINHDFRETVICQMYKVMNAERQHLSRGSFIVITGKQDYNCME